MDCEKIGNLILKLRKEKGFTQKDVADKMNISDKTISKWERGLGCPDVSLLNELSDIFGVKIEQILNGELCPNETDGGNMKKIKFYVCKECGNVLTGTGNAEISCCGRKLEPLKCNKSNSKHNAMIENFDNEYYVNFNHSMTKEHYISFAAYVSYDRVVLVKLYPEQDAEVRFAKMHKGKLYFYCTEHGLFEV